MAAKLAIVDSVKPKRDYTGVTLPFKSPIDKVAALVLFQVINDRPLETVGYWTSNECSDEESAKAEIDRIYLIDIGARKYNQLPGVPSAMAYVAKDFGVEGELSVGLNKVLGLINENNRTGNLKKRFYPIAGMMRLFYELHDDVSFHIAVITEVAEVIKAFVMVEDGQTAQAIDGLEDALPDLVQKFAGCNDSPMTLGRYLRDLWLLGNEPHEIRKKIDWWLTHDAHVKRRQARAQEKLARFNSKEWDVAGTKAVIVNTDDHFFSGAVINKKDSSWGIRVIVDRSGHTTISTNGYDLSAVYDWLQKEEPGKWFHQVKQCALINGGLQYVGVEPTKISPVTLMYKMQALCRPKGAPKPAPAKAKDEQKGDRRDHGKRKHHGNRRRHERKPEQAGETAMAAAFKEATAAPQADAVDGTEAAPANVEAAPQE